jgi:2'-5' RNA ligase
MQKYVLVKLLETIDEGTEFSARNWPLHVTIASNFAVDWEATGLFEKLRSLLAKQKPVTTTAADDEYFGSQKHIHVTLLDMSSELRSLHNDIIALLKGVGAVFDEPHYREANFRAHATVQPHARLHKGDHITINDITIVDVYPHNDIQQRKILRTIELSGT